MQYGSFMGTSEYSSEYQPCKRPNYDKLQWECHNEVSAVGGKIIRQEITGKAIAMIYAKYTGKQNLPDYSEDLD